MPKRRKRGRPRTGSWQVVPVRLPAKSVKKIAKLAELEGVDRSTVLRMLIDIGLDSPRVSLLMRPPRVKGSTAVQRVIRVVAAERQVLATQSALLRAPSAKTEVNALRAEEELAEAQAAYDHHHPKPPGLRRRVPYLGRPPPVPFDGRDRSRHHASNRHCSRCP